MLGVCHSRYSVDDTADHQSPKMISPSNKVMQSKNGNKTRTIAYAIYRPKSIVHGEKSPQKSVAVPTRAILWFYPLGGCSISVDHAAPSFLQHNYNACVISVDRPGVGATDSLATAADHAATTNNFPMDRIQGHADDVLEVLEHEGIIEVYILAVCLGHPYALEVSRRLMTRSNDDNSDNHNSIQLKGMALVAPFVSSACPQSWRVVRLGNRVPSFVLSWATEIMVSAEKRVLPMVLSESALKKLVSEEEREYFGWHEADFQDIVKGVSVMIEQTAPSKSTEARLGVSALWQQICDDFAVESGCGLNLNEHEVIETKEVNNETKLNLPSFPIQIHACREDKIAPGAAVEWLARRCFGTTEITWHPEAHSHEIMTFLGGPPRSPFLLHEIAKSWHLADGGTESRKGSSHKE